MPTGFFAAYVAFMNATRSSVYLGNSDCVRATLNSQYWKAMEKLAPTEVAGSRTGIILFIVAALVLVAALSVAFFVVYCKKQANTTEGEDEQVVV